MNSEDRRRRRFALAVLFAASGGLFILTLKQNEPAEANDLARVQFELGKVYLENARAIANDPQADFFAAAMMAGRAIGFEGFGRDSEDRHPSFAERFPCLIRTETHPSLVETVQGGTTPVTIG